MLSERKGVRVLIVPARESPTHTAGTAGGALPSELIRRERYSLLTRTNRTAHS